MPGVKGRSGGRQKSAARRKLEGSRKRPHHYTQAEPASVDLGEPMCPEWFDEHEGEAWLALPAQLRLQKRLSLDAAEWLIAAASAQADFIQWRAAALNETLIIETEAGPKAHPAHQQHRLARKAWLDILKEGGLTPASVVRVKMPEVPDEEPGDPFTAIDAKRDARAQIRRVK